MISKSRFPVAESDSLSTCAVWSEGYREQNLTLYQISEMLDEADLDREAALFEAASRRDPR
jgi:hypothetical protein